MNCEHVMDRFLKCMFLNASLNKSNLETYQDICGIYHKQFLKYCDVYSKQN